MTGKHKKHDRPKRGLKLFFFPKAQGQKHKHKKNKYYVSQDDWSSSGSVMSGDSPAHHNRTAEVFDFNQSPNQTDGRPQLLDSKPPGADGRSSPIATTSKDVAVQSNSTDEKVGDKQGKGEVQASVLVEPGGGKDKDEDDEHFGSPTLNNSETKERGTDEERRGKNNDEGFGGRDKKDRKDDKFRKNGNIDKLDGVWVPKDKKQHEDEEEDNCIVKCLYVTMACCECSIM